MSQEQTKIPISGDGRPLTSFDLEVPSPDSSQYQYEGPLEDAVYSPPPLLRPEKLIGNSEALYNLVEAIGTAAQTNQNVLIQGETGTGKTLAARTIHAQSARSDHWLIVINCAVLGPDQLPSLLLGSSGPSSEGLFEAASGGIIAFDHVDQLAPEAQAQLNHILQTHSFDFPLDAGSSAFDLRLLFLSSDRLPNEAFNTNLYYRLDQFPIRVPPLRDRPEDIVPLARHFLRHERRQAGAEPDYSLSETARGALRTHDWPGNVREVRNAMTRAAAVCEGTTIEADDLPPALQEAAPKSVQTESSAPEPSSSHASAPNEAPSSDADSPFVVHTDAAIPKIEEIKREAVKHAYNFCDGDIDRAAVELDIARSTMYRLLKRYDLK